jgi:hypothetical protein
VEQPTTPWPETRDELIQLQVALAQDAEAALATSPWKLSGTPIIGGCFVAFARGQSGHGHPGDEAWAAAVAWRPGSSPISRQGEPYRRSDDMLRGASTTAPRRASDIEDQAVVAGRVPASYAPGLLALRQGPILAAAVARLSPVPDVLLVDATGLDHPWPMGSFRWRCGARSAPYTWRAESSATGCAPEPGPVLWWPTLAGARTPISLVPSCFWHRPGQRERRSLSKRRDASLERPVPVRARTNRVPIQSNYEEQTGSAISSTSTNLLREAYG